MRAALSKHDRHNFGPGDMPVEAKFCGPLPQVLRSLPAELSAAIRARVDAAMADFATPDGYELPGVSLLGVGHR
jgi:hypothetical protein